MSYRQTGAGALLTNINQITQDYTITDNDTYGYIECSFSSTSKIIYVGLPSVASNLGRIIFIKNIGDGFTMVTSTSLIDKSTGINLYNYKNYALFICGSSGWRIQSLFTSMNTGFCDRSDFLGALIGNVVINTTGVLTDYFLGEIVESTSGNTGRILEKGSTYVILYDITGTGTFSTSQILTGKYSSQATLIASSKSSNAETNLIHNWVADIKYIKSELYLSTAASFNNCFEMRTQSEDGTNSQRGYAIHQVSTNVLKLRTANDGIIYVQSAGAVTSFTNGYSNIIINYII
jgi:hypothetical protein